MTEDLVNSMRELIRCYDIYKGQSDLNLEVNMWRGRFINEQFGLTQEQICLFLCMPSEQFIQNTPEGILKEICKMKREP